VRLLSRRDYSVDGGVVVARKRGAPPKSARSISSCATCCSKDGNGGECLRQLTAVRPDISPPLRVRHRQRRRARPTRGASSRDVPILTKPFTAGDLDRVLGNVEVGV
jgi:hypothetical protein